MAEDLKEYMGEELPEVRRNVTPDTRPYKEMYDDETIQIVADWYKIDIDTFGFDFDSAATKNTIGT